MDYGGFSGVNFTIPPAGGVIVGAAEVDHTSLRDIEALPAHVFWVCLPRVPANLTYSGPPWSYSINQTLAPGHYGWAPRCGGFANITVTQSIEILNP